VAKTVGALTKRGRHVGLGRFETVRQRSVEIVTAYQLSWCRVEPMKPAPVPLPAGRALPRVRRAT
jgi:hypothetical protein